MADYYGYQQYYAVPYTSGHYRDEMEYAGYDNSWVLGREKELPHGSRRSHYNTRYGGYDAYQQYDYSRPRSRSQSYVHHEPYETYNPVRYAWPTEDQVTLRISLCCEGCRWKLDEALRKITGVYDVGITGWSNALVIVKGSAPPFKILEKARKVSKTAELCSARSSHDHYSRWY